MPVKLIIFVVLSLIVAVFIVKNVAPVELRYYDIYLEPQSVSIPLFLIMLISLAFGFSLAWVDGWVAKMKLKSVIRRNNRTIEALDDELRKYKKPALPEYTESDR